jgi:hypothetical protein
MIYITATADPTDNGAELRCTDHPKWWADADGTNLPDAIRSATDHFRDEHRVHVDACVCRGTQVIDQRCIPTTAPHSAPGMPPGAPERAREMAETMPTVGQWPGESDSGSSSSEVDRG